MSVGSERTTAQGKFGPMSNSPANRGKNTYQVSFAGDKDFAATTQTCVSQVHGTATKMTADEPAGVSVGDNLKVTGALKTIGGGAVADADITATDTVDGTETELADTTTDKDGGFTVTVPGIAAGEHKIELAFAGDEVNEPATTDTSVTLENGTTLAVEPIDPMTAGEDVAVAGTLVTGDGKPVADATITATDTVNDGAATELADATTDSDGAFTLTAPSVAAGNHTIDVSYAGNSPNKPATGQVTFVATQENGTTLAVEPVDPMVADKDVEVSGTLMADSGDPVAGATITATDTVGGTATELADATTDSEGAFTITVPKAAAGNHTVDLTFAGDPPNKPATGQVRFNAKYQTKLTLSGPADLPTSPEPVTFTITLTDGAGDPVSDVNVVLNDGGTWEQGTKTDANGQATYTKPGVSDEAPLRIDVTFAGNPTYWEASTHQIWKGTPRFSLTKDKPTYTAGDSASLTLSSPNGNLPTTIALKPYKRPAVAVDPSDTGETAVSPTMFRTSTLTISTEATDRWKPGSRTFTIRVAPKITQTLNGSYDQSGDTYLVRKTKDPQLTAKVLPARPGRCATAVVQKSVNGTYTTVKRACRTLTIESTASYKLIGNPAAGAKFRIRFESAADDMNMAGHSEWTYLKFTN